MSRLENAFLAISVPEGCTDDCIYLVKTKDMYATGDSPTCYDCTGTPLECPQLNCVDAANDS